MYPPEMLDYSKYLEANQCPINDNLCEEAVWFSQNMLIAEKSDMDDIASAIKKIKKNAGKLKNMEHMLSRTPDQENYVVY